MFGAAPMSVPRERILICESLHDHLEVVHHDLDSVGVAIPRRLHLALEVAFDHGPIVVDPQVAAPHWVQVVAL